MVAYRRMLPVAALCFAFVACSKQESPRFTYLEKLAARPPALSLAAWFTANGNEVCSYEQTGVKIWRVADGKLINTVFDTAGMAGLSAAPSGTLAVSHSRDTTIVVRDLAAGTIIRTFPGDWFMSGMAITPDERSVITAESIPGGKITVRRLSDGSVEREFGTGAPVQRLLIAPDGKHIVTVNADSIEVWRLPDGVLMTTMRHVGVHPVVATTSREIVVAAMDTSTHATSLTARRLSDGSSVWSQRVRGWIYALGVTPDSRTLVALGNPSGVQIRKMSDGSLERETPPAAGEMITDFGLSPDGKNVVVVSPEGAEIESLADGHVTQSLEEAKGRTYHTGPVFAVAFTPDGQNVVSVGADRRVAEWRARDGELVRTMSGDGGLMQSLAISPDGRLVAAGSRDSTVHVWNLDDGDMVRTLKGHTAPVWYVSFSPDGRYLFSTSSDRTVRMWRVSDGTLVRTFEHPLDVNCAVPTPDGKYLVTACKDHAVRIWRIADGDLVRTLHGHTGSVYRVAVSPDGRTIFSSGPDGTLRRWRFSDGSLLHTFTDRLGMANCVAFSPDGKYFLTSYLGINVFRMSDDSLVTTLNAARTGLDAVAISPGGSLVVGGTGFGGLAFWSVNPPMGTGKFAKAASM